MKHEYVDLALPSGTLWATCNVGANKPEEIGDHFAWGETVPKKEYTWKNYKWCNGTEKTQTKYCTTKKYGAVDNLTTLELADDAATANWGLEWRMPTIRDFKELVDNCDCKFLCLNGSDGIIFVSKNNGCSIFLPSSDNGQWLPSFAYWSAQLAETSNDGENSWATSDCAYSCCTEKKIEFEEHWRFNGFSVRAVMTTLKGNEPAKVSAEEWDRAFYRYKQDIEIKFNQHKQSKDEEITSALEEVRKFSPELCQRITETIEEIKLMRWEARCKAERDIFLEAYPNLRIDNTENNILRAIHEGIRKREGEPDGPNKIYCNENYLFQDPRKPSLSIKIGRYEEVKTESGVESRLIDTYYKVIADGMSFHTEGYEKTVTDLEADVKDFLQWLECTHLTEKFATGKFLPPKVQDVPGLPF